MTDWKAGLREYLDNHPELREQYGGSSVENAEESLVNRVLALGDDPNFPMEPEQQFGLPKQLKTIAALRKQGYDNATIFKSLELEEAEEDEVRQEQAREKKKTEPSLRAAPDPEAPNFFERLYLPTLREFQAGGFKKLIGGTMMTHGAVSTREESELY